MHSWKQHAKKMATKLYRATFQILACTVVSSSHKPELGFHHIKSQYNSNSLIKPHVLREWDNSTASKQTTIIFFAYAFSYWLCIHYEFKALFFNFTKWINCSRNPMKHALNCSYHMAFDLVDACHMLSKVTYALWMPATWITLCFKCQIQKYSLADVWISNST